VIGQGVWILWGVENCHLPLTKPVALNTGLALPRSPWLLTYLRFLYFAWFKGHLFHCCLFAAWRISFLYNDEQNIVQLCSSRHCCRKVVEASSSWRTWLEQVYYAGRAETSCHTEYTLNIVYSCFCFCCLQLLALSNGSAECNKNYNSNK